MKNIEIMAPVGSYEALRAAIKAGAKSVYFGIEKLNMRARAASNFTLEDLRNIAKICEENNMKSYLTLNTVLYDDDLKLMREICNVAKESNITAIIACDVAAMKYAKSIGLEVHLSTQANVSNIEAVKFYAQFVDVVVLARELTIEQIKEICKQIKEDEVKGPNGKLIEVEIFVHGALCVSISGKCYMSLATYNASANRGACLQNCRRAYRVIDDETGKELVIDNKYVMSPKDLCTIKFLDKIIDAGVSILKIEGRGRAPEYVYTVTKVYKEAVEDFSKEKVEGWIKMLESVYNRGFWHGGYYFAKSLEEWSGEYGSQATKKKEYIGKVRNYFSKVKVAEFIIESGEVKVGDDLLITGPTTGVVEAKVESIYKNEKSVEKVGKGDDITVPVMEKVRFNDKVFLIKES